MSIVSVESVDKTEYKIVISKNHEDLDKIHITEDGLYNVKYIRNGELVSRSGRILSVVVPARLDPSGFILFDWSEDNCNRKERIYFSSIYSIEDITPDSAYDIAVKHGFKGSIDDWLESLKGEPGKNNYELACENGYKGSLEEWLEKCQGPEGKSAYDVAVANGYEHDEKTWLNELKGHFSLSIANSFDEGKTMNENPVPGDMLLVHRYIETTDTIVNDFYMYNDGAWQELYGNRSADNVVFEDDIRTSYKIGCIDVDEETGYGVIHSKGKTLKETFEEIFYNGELPTVEDPTITLDIEEGEESQDHLIEAGIAEAGSVLNIKYTVALDPGSYSFGPATGITMSKVSVEDSGHENKEGEEETFTTKTIPDTGYSLTANVDLTEAAIPLTDTGKECAERKITTNHLTASGSIAGIRYSFYGILKSEATEADSAVIRALNKMTYGSVDCSIKREDTPDEQYIVFAVPTTLLSTHQAVFTCSDEEPREIQNRSVDVDGANGYTPVAYTLYYYKLLDTDNGISVTMTISEKDE